MAVHIVGPRPGLRQPLLLAYVFWPVPVLTPRAFDAALSGPLARLWGELRARRLIRRRYYGRGE